MRLTRTPHSAGVTLVEVVIAIFILTVGVLGIVSLFPTGYALGQRALDRSVAALAARDALARLHGEIHDDNLTLPSKPDTDTGTEPLYLYNASKQLGVPPRNRVGTIVDISAHALTCRIRGDIAPSTSSTSVNHWPNLADYYFVITSGTSAGRVFPISSSTGGQVTFASSITFRTGTSSPGIRVRVGDHFAIIGSKSGSQCFPSADTDDHSSFLGSGNDRTWEIATHGRARPHRDGGFAPWEYSYACILSASSHEAKHLYRVDIFLFRRFSDDLGIHQQDSPAGHFVTYLSQLDDYDSP